VSIAKYGLIIEFTIRNILHSASLVAIKVNSTHIE